MTTLAEPEWDEATREMVLAFHEWDQCPACGGPAYLCQDPKREFDWKVADPVRCHRLTALLAKKKGITEETNPHTDALVWGTKLREGASDV